MEAVRETTQWNDNLQINHIYLLDGSKAVAYIKFGKGEPFYFSKPMNFDKRGRTFEKVSSKLFKGQ
jgi:hypothetical protein